MMILREARAPNFIEYLSLDTEGTEFVILNAPGLLDDFTFGAITVEHNYESAKRAAIDRLLTAHEYVWVKSVGPEDFFRHKDSWRVNADNPPAPY